MRLEERDEKRSTYHEVKNASVSSMDDILRPKYVEDKASHLQLQSGSSDNNDRLRYMLLLLKFHALSISINDASDL